MTHHQPQLTIFISSMIGPLWDQRAAIEEAITTGIPLARPWVFERAPASSEEITESYLARVRECDIYLLILGDDPVLAKWQWLKLDREKRQSQTKGVIWLADDELPPSSRSRIRLMQAFTQCGVPLRDDKPEKSDETKKI